MGPKSNLLRTLAAISGVESAYRRGAQFCSGLAEGVSADLVSSDVW